jgi:calcineurin-like phosphoesterase family protein
MNATLIDRYNAMIKPDQICLWVGDAFFMPFGAAAEVMKRLNGQKVLIRGNHDRSTRSIRLGFMAVFNELTFQLAERSIRVNHYPYWKNSDQFRKTLESSPLALARFDKMIKRRPKKIKGEILIHGHVHGKKRVRENMINVGVDAWEYAPVSIKEIEKLIEGMSIPKNLV